MKARRLFLTILMAAFLVAAAVIPSPAQSRPALDSFLAPATEADDSADRQAFFVNLDVDRDDRCYEDGELVRATVQSERDGFLYVFVVSGDDSAICLFPNNYDRNNRISANQEIVVPSPEAPFKLRVKAPFGEEALVALVSEAEISAESLGAKSLIEEPATKVSWSKAVEVVPEYQCAHDMVLVRTVKSRTATDSTNHAEANRTRPRVESAESAANEGEADEADGTARTKRFGFFVGITKHRYLSDLDMPSVSNSLDLMVATMKDYGDLDGMIVLRDEEASHDGIQAGFAKLAEATKPGDEIFLYWIGHGGRLRQSNGRAANVLCVYDTRETEEDEKKNLVWDTELAEWLRLLDKRRIAILVDSCFSGGLLEHEPTDTGRLQVSPRPTHCSLGGSGLTEIQPGAMSDALASLQKGSQTGDKESTEPSLNSFLDHPAEHTKATGDPQPEFLIHLLKRLKAIDEGNAAVILSSSATQSSLGGFEFAGKEYGLASFCFAAAVIDAPLLYAGAGRRVTLEEAWKFMKAHVMSLGLEFDMVQTPVYYNPIGEYFVRP